MSRDEQPSVDQKTWALVNLYLGLVHHYSHPPEWNQAIDAYSEAVEAWPQLITPRLNRSVAYEKRRRPGDLGNAPRDVNAVIALKPDWSSAYNNRASLGSAK